MKSVCIIQARMSSTRLPGKVMLPLGGRTVLWHVLTRAMRIPGIDLVVLAVPESDASLPLSVEAAALGIPIVYGPEHDVLTRYYRAAVIADADIIMRVTADCPMLDSAICGEVLALVKAGADYASNVCPRGFPKGLDCEAFTMAALDEANHFADSKEDREHVTPYMQRSPGLKRVNLDGELNPEVRWTLDTHDDYAFLSAVFDRTGDDWRVIQ